MVRLHDRRKRASRPRQIWRHLRVAMRLLLKHPIPSVAVLPVLADGRILLIRRVDTDRWALPGGLIDWGETVEEAGRRELDEESGLALDEVERLVGVYSSPRRDPRAHSISVVIAARVSGEPEIQDRLEVSEIRAFRRDEIPMGYLSHDHAEHVRDYLEGRTAVR